MKQYFFLGAPLSDLFPVLEKVQRSTSKIRNFIQRSLIDFELLIGQGNRPDRIHTHLVSSGVIPKFDYYFTGSKVGEENISFNWFEREMLDGKNEHTPYIWNSQKMWEQFFHLLNKNQGKKILVSSSAPRDQHKLLANYSNVLFASPPPEVAVYFGDDKRKMYEIYSSLGLQYEVINYASTEDVLNDYNFHSEQLHGKSLVVQATIGSGGVTENDKRALYFTDNEDEFHNSIENLRGEGPLRIMKKYDGIPSNTAALSLPLGTYISAIPSVKPCGVTEIGAKMGTSGGNQWDTRFPIDAIDSQFYQIKKVGEKMASSGYNGVFGLDPIMPFTQNGLVFNSEINARAQGPDSQRASSALAIGIPCLEEMQLAFYLGCPSELFPDPSDYNLITRWLKIPPYLKLFPKEDSFVKANFNGYWRFQNGTLIRSDLKDASFKITGAPRVGQKILRDSPDNFLYVKFIDVDTKIYTDGTNPRLTSNALEISDYLYENIVL